jgi:hypothetical protein
VHAYAAISEALPVGIDEANWSDPVLTLSGRGWSLSTLCPWRVSDRGGLVVADTSRDAEDLIWELIGKSVLDVSFYGASVVDPVFKLSSREWLELFSNAPSDTWVLRLPEITVVGPLTPSDVGDPQDAR